MQLHVQVYKYRYCNRFKYQQEGPVALRSRVPAQGPEPIKNHKTKLLLPAFWQVSLHRRRSRASGGPATRENVGSNEHGRLEWHPSESRFKHVCIYNALKSAMFDQHHVSAEC